MSNDNLTQNLAPPRAFKFMSNKYLDDFLSGKNIRIGTLNDFRNIEVHELDKGDPFEGVLEVVNSPDGVGNFSPITDYGAPEQKEVAEFIKKNTGIDLGNSKIGGAMVDVRIEAPNCLVFCSSYDCEPQVGASLDGEYDRCVRIGNYANFVHEIAIAISEKYGSKVFIEFRPVLYVPRRVKPSATNIALSPFLKDPRFAPQKEWRVCFYENIGDCKFVDVSIDTSKCDMKTVWKRDEGEPIERVDFLTAKILNYFHENGGALPDAETLPDGAIINYPSKSK